MIEHWQLPLLMTFLAGFATVIGGFITFLVHKENLKVLSLGLGFSAGVMIFVSLTEILTTAENMLKTYYPVKYHRMLFGGFIAGVIISKLIGYSQVKSVIFLFGTVLKLMVFNN